MPLLGLGVSDIAEGPECFTAVRTALNAGYRLIDTASFYENEKSVGQAVVDSGISRDQIFVTTKLWNRDHGYENALRAFDRSMNKLGLDYVDLYMIHHPIPELRLESWKALEQIVTSSGRCRAIGVSNYTPQHINELLSHCTIPPVVNQIELSPYCFASRLDIVNLCIYHGIAVESYCPLLRAQKLNDPPLVRLAAKYKKTSAQILIRWALQENIVVIPKSSKRLHILENANVFDFEITPYDMEYLCALDEDFIVCGPPNPED